MLTGGVFYSWDAIVELVNVILLMIFAIEA